MRGAGQGYCPSGAADNQPGGLCAAGLVPAPGWRWPNVLFTANTGFAACSSPAARNAGASTDLGIGGGGGTCQPCRVCNLRLSQHRIVQLRCLAAIRPKLQSPTPTSSPSSHFVTSATPQLATSPAAAIEVHAEALGGIIE